MGFFGRTWGPEQRVHKATEQARGSGRIPLQANGAPLRPQPLPLPKMATEPLPPPLGLFLRAAPVQSAVDNCLGRRAGDAIGQ